MNVIIEENVIVRKGVTIGDNSVIKVGVILGTGVTIGENCYVGPGAILLHGLPDGSSQPCELGDYVFIGANATILPKVKICSGTIIGAGAVVTKSIAKAATYAGNPCKKISDAVFTPLLMTR